MCLTLTTVCASAVAGAPRVPGGAAREVSEDDRGEAPGVVARWRLQRGGGPESTQVSL